MKPIINFCEQDVHNTMPLLVRYFDGKNVNINPVNSNYIPIYSIDSDLISIKEEKVLCNSLNMSNTYYKSSMLSVINMFKQNYGELTKITLTRSGSILLVGLGTIIELTRDTVYNKFTLTPLLIATIKKENILSFAKWLLLCSRLESNNNVDFPNELITMLVHSNISRLSPQIFTVIKKDFKGCELVYNNELISKCISLDAIEPYTSLEADLKAFYDNLIAKNKLKVETTEKIVNFEENLVIA